MVVELIPPGNACDSELHHRGASEERDTIRESERERARPRERARERERASERARERERERERNETAGHGSFLVYEALTYYCMRP